MGLAIDSKDYLFDPNFGQGLNHILDRCFGNEREDRFRAVKSEGPHSGSIASD